MLCDKCKKNMANVHVSRVINGVKYEQNLCGECAGLEAGGIFSGFENMLGGLREMSMMGAALPSPATAPQQAGEGAGFEALGLTLPDLQEAKPEEAQRESIPMLKNQLDAAVKNEEFEKAAELRDRIYFLEKEENNEKGKE